MQGYGGGDPPCGGWPPYRGVIRPGEGRDLLEAAAMRLQRMAALQMGLRLE